MADENVAFTSVSLKDGTKILCKGIESISGCDLRGSAGSMSRQVWCNDLIAQPREEVQLAAPNVKRSSHTVHEEQRYVRVCPFAARDHPLRVDQHCALGLAAAAARRWSRFLLPKGRRDRRGNRVGVGRRGHLFVVSQLHLDSATRLQIPILTLQDLRVQNITEVLNHQLAVAVDGDLPLAVDTAAGIDLVLKILRGALILAVMALLLARHLLFCYYGLTLRDDVSHTQDSSRFHLHKLKTIGGLCRLQGQNQAGCLSSQAAQYALSDTGQHGAPLHKQGQTEYVGLHEHKM